MTEPEPYPGNERYARCDVESLDVVVRVGSTVLYLGRNNLGEVEEKTRVVAIALLQNALAQLDRAEHRTGAR